MMQRMEPQQDMGVVKQNQSTDAQKPDAWTLDLWSTSLGSNEHPVPRSEYHRKYI